MLVRRRPLLFLGALACVAPWAMAGCKRDDRGVGEKQTPFTLVLSPAHGKNGESVRELERLLARHSELAVEIQVAPSSEAAVRMAGSPNVDGALLTLFDYLLCRQMYGVAAGLRVVRKNKSEHHRGEIVAKTGAGVKTLGDLAGKRFAYVDRYSSTGYVLPAKQLHDAGVKVEPSFAGSHDAALAELRSGSVAGAATYAGAHAGAVDLTVIAETPAIPNEPVFFRSGLPPDKRKRVEAALVRIAETPDDRKVLLAIADIEGFVPTNDGGYDAAERLISSIGRSVKDLVPRGWVLSNESERKPADLAP